MRPLIGDARTIMSAADRRATLLGFLPASGARSKGRRLADALDWDHASLSATAENVAVADVCPGVVMIGLQFPQAPDRVFHALWVHEETPELLEACAKANVHAGETRPDSDGRPGFDRATELLRGAIRDIVAAAEAEATLAETSESLEQSYDTIDLLFNIGKSSAMPQDPGHVLVTLLDELLAGLHFRWTASVMDVDRALQTGMTESIIVRARDATTVRAAERALQSWRNADGLPESGSVLRVGDRWSIFGTEAIVEPFHANGTVTGALIAADLGPNASPLTGFECRLLAAAAAQVGPILRGAEYVAGQRDLFLGTVRSLTSAIDAKDPYTRGHSDRVAHLSVELARRLGWGERDVETVHLAGVVHDVGKIGVPESILLKSSALTNAEFEIIKQHPEIGHRILEDIPGLENALPGVLHHHERWDGRGYPHGLAGEQIPQIARVLAIADAFDAMTSNRAYRKGLPRDAVLREVVDSAGKQFDPKLVPAFVSLDFSGYDLMVQNAVAQHSANDDAQAPDDSKRAA